MPLRSARRTHDVANRWLEEGRRLLRTGSANNGRPLAELPPELRGFLSLFLPVMEEWLNDFASDEGIHVHHARGGERFTVGRMIVEILGPDECTDTGPNDNSVVLRLRYGNATVLFTGDAERPAQQDLLEDPDTLAADVLKVPHQGGDTSLEEFFKRIGAQVAVVSVGPNDYGHPVPEVLEALERTGAVVLRTDEVGDVTIQFTPEGLSVQAPQSAAWFTGP